MMGRLADQGQLFYRFKLEDHVPDDHFLRRVDRFIDLKPLRAELAALYSHTGRPSIDPELMIRMLLIGYRFVRDIASSLTTQRTTAKPHVPLLFFKTPKYAGSVQLGQSLRG